MARRDGVYKQMMKREAKKGVYAEAEGDMGSTLSREKQYLEKDSEE